MPGTFAPAFKKRNPTPRPQKWHFPVKESQNIPLPPRLFDFDTFILAVIHQQINT
jgi:hypothetical protein